MIAFIVWKVRVAYTSKLKTVKVNDLNTSLKASVERKRQRRSSQLSDTGGSKVHGENKIISRKRTKVKGKKKESTIGDSENPSVNAPVLYDQNLEHAEINQ